ncbi:hypothetical protein M9458_050641 [Cirrhinus mrigala]|uniref:Uncharacterized protein n=1 Tax=Cirrhinus mrigala TaxID=683832 RepID=A0ABD0MVS3_CIRMR
MAILQVHQAQALKQLHEGRPDMGLMQERRTATDFTLRATKVLALSLGQVMSMMVVQERHLWLNLAQMAGVDKVCFLDAHVSQAGLFSNTVGQLDSTPRTLRFPGTSVNAPLIPLAYKLEAWLALPSPSTRLRNLVRQASAQVQGRPFHICPDCGFPIKRCNQACAKIKSGFSLVHRTQEERPSSSELVPSDVNVQDDWFAPIELKDVYFHALILPQHRPFLRFAFEGWAYQYKGLPFQAGPVPPCLYQTHGGRVSAFLNYLDDWLNLAYSDLVLWHLSHLGLWVNGQRSKLSPVQSISFLSMKLDSDNMTARLTNKRAQYNTAVPLKRFQRLQGHMAATATVMPLGLLHMRFTF